MPVSLAAVGPAFGRVTFDWMHEIWNERGLVVSGIGRWMLSMMASAGESALRPIRTADAEPPAPAVVASSADGSDFLSTATDRTAGGKPAVSAAVADAMVFCPCPATENASASSCSSRSDGGFADIGEQNEDVICPLCELYDDDLRNGPDGTSVGVREVVICEGCQGGFHVACVRALQSLRRRGLEANHPAAVQWTEAGMTRGPSTWRCGACMDEGRWGVSHLIESAATFNDSRCLAKSATYSVLVRFHADGAPPEPRFLHGRRPPGCTHVSEIQDLELVSDLQRRQVNRSQRGQDPHGKLKRLLDCPPLTGPAWFRPDMTSEQHVATFRAFLSRPPESTRAWAHAQEFRSVSDEAYQTALLRDRQAWMLREPCSRSDLVVTAYSASKQGLFRLPAQGWDRRVAEDAERRLRALAPAPVSDRRSLRHQSSPGAQVIAGKVEAELAGILQEVVRGARLLYDGLPVHSLGEEQLVEAVNAHLDRPCVADAESLLRSFVSAAGLDVAALRRSSPDLVQSLERRAAEVQTAVEVSRAYWLELADVLATQRQARAVRVRTVRRSQCLHRKRRKLATKGWQPRAYDPDTKPACAGMKRWVVSRDRRALFSDLVVGPAGTGAAAQGGRCASSSSSRERASGEAARQGVPASQARAHHSPPSPSREDFDNHAG